jgi:hypothetical protein
MSAYGNGWKIEQSSPNRLKVSIQNLSTSGIYVFTYPFRATCSEYLNPTNSFTDYPKVIKPAEKDWQFIFPGKVCTWNIYLTKSLISSELKQGGILIKFGQYVHLNKMGIEDLNTDALILPSEILLK